MMFEFLEIQFLGLNLTQGQVGAAILLLLLCLIGFLIWLFYRPEKQTPFCEQEEEDPDVDVDAVVGDFSPEDGGYHVFFIFQGKDSVGLLDADEGFLTPGMVVRAQIVDPGASIIHLIPLEWPKNIAPENAFVTYCDEDGVLHCAYCEQRSKLQLAGIVGDDDVTLESCNSQGEGYVFPIGRIDAENRMVFMRPSSVRVLGDVEAIIGKYVPQHEAYECTFHFGGAEHKGWFNAPEGLKEGDVFFANLGEDELNSEGAELYPIKWGGLPSDSVFVTMNDEMGFWHGAYMDPETGFQKAGLIVAQDAKITVTLGTGDLLFIQRIEGTKIFVHG